jgi:hypothetical protein
VVRSEKKKEEARSEVLPNDLVLPHHTWLAKYASQQVRNGRRVLVFCQHTGTDDLMPDIAAKVTRLAAEEHGTTLKVGVLRSTTVKPGDRSGWFEKAEAEGTNVVLCNPALVKTGLNLVGWPSIVVLEPVYSLYTLAQAVRRAYRPTQTRTCEVTYVAYAETMSERALDIVAEKLAAMAMLSGDEISDGLVAGKGDSLMQELAKLVREGEGGDAMNRDVKAALAANAQAFTAAMRSGASDLLVGKPAAAEVVAEPEPELARAVGQDEPAEPKKPTTLAEKVKAQQDTARRRKKATVVHKDQIALF